MKTRLQVLSIPDAQPIKTTVAVRSLADGTTLTQVPSDDDGFVLLQRDGHLEPYYFHFNGLPGGDKFWSSTEMMTAGPTSPWDWPTALLPLGNGVVADYEGAFAVSVSNSVITILNGAALIQGHPIVYYFNTFFSVARPVSGTRTDRVIIRLYPAGSATTPGKADVVVLQGEDTIGTVPTLTQTTTVYELPLARITVPVAGTLTATDERQFLQAERHDPTADSVVANGPIVTDEAGGEALSGLSLTLALPDEGTYDITASLSAVQGPVAGSTNWTNVATYGPTFNSIALSSPAQVAVDQFGRILIADTGNTRLVILDSAGAYSTGVAGLTGITGVCTDLSNNIYIAYGSAGFGAIRKYDSSLTQQWSFLIGDGSNARHITTDGTHVYFTTSATLVRKWLCSTGAAVTSWGSVGTGNGQFMFPWGITMRATEVCVVDQDNARVQVFNTSGTYQRQWATTQPSRGIAVDASGRVWVAETGADLLKQYTSTGTLITSLSQSDPDGIAVALGDALWTTNLTAGTVAKWDEVATGSGYGQLAVEIDGSVGSYTGPGNRNAAIKTTATGSKAGGYDTTVVVRAFGKATSGEATFKSLVLSAEAQPRR